MKTIAMSLVLTLAGAAMAQSPPPPVTAEAAPPPAVKETWPAGDPRACLEFPTRQQIIACAEKYRPRRPAAKP